MASTIDAESSKLPSQGHTPTALGILISGAKNCDQKVTIPQNSTLNEVYGVMSSQAIGTKEGKNFKLGWYGIGIKGSKCIGENAQGVEVRRILEHKATDANAFVPIPFLIRELSKDISSDERKKYRLRVIKKIGSVTYVMYYLKEIGFDLYDPKVKLGYRDPVTGNNSEENYTYKTSDLNPTPYELLTTDSVPISNQYVSGNGVLNLTLEAADLDEIRNVCSIIFGTTSVAAISEVYLVHGINTTNQGQIQGGTTNYNELCPACVSYQITELYGRDANTNNRLKIYFSYGNSVSLLTQLTQSTETLAILG